MQPDLNALRFDPIQHRYWIGTQELLSVTQVLRDAGVVDAVWHGELARERGRAVHQATEALDRDHVSRAWPPHLDPYLCAYQDFLRDAQPVWHGIETAVADPGFGYAGTIDRWGTLQGDAVVVDLKTGTIPPWAPLQLVAYARLASGHPDGRRRRRLVVQLLPTGRYSVREYPVINFGRDERVFLAALAVAHWKRAA